MAGQLSFNLASYQEAATKWRPELLKLPIISCRETLKYMTERPGIRYKENVGTASADAQFGPYKASRSTNVDLKLEYRELETFFASVVAKFEPNSAVSKLIGAIGDTKGDGQKNTITAREVLALIASGLGEHLNDVIWSAKRNANGDTSADLFNGFDTITETEITAGKIAKSEGNYLKLSEEITRANAVDIAKDILFSLDPRLRAQDINMYCSQHFVDMYNEGMKLAGGGISYYTNYEQNTVEGSNGRLHLIPLYNKAESKFIHITPKSNMLVGYDQMGDMESVAVEKHEPFILDYIATMFFGCQFETIDKRRFMTVELAGA